MHRYPDPISQKRNVWAHPIFRIRFRPLDRRDAVSWVEMDYRQKEWSKEVNKEQYLSYVALEVVLLSYTYAACTHSCSSSHGTVSLQNGKPTKILLNRFVLVLYESQKRELSYNSTIMFTTHLQPRRILDQYRSENFQTIKMLRSVINIELVNTGIFMRISPQQLRITLIELPLRGRLLSS